MVRVRKRSLFWKHGSITTNKDEKSPNVLSKCSVVCCLQMLKLKHWCVGRQPSHMMKLSLSCHSSPDVKQLIYYLIWAWHDTSCRTMFKPYIANIVFQLILWFSGTPARQSFCKTACSFRKAYQHHSRGWETANTTQTPAGTSWLWGRRWGDCGNSKPSSVTE